MEVDGHPPLHFHLPLPETGAAPVSVRRGKVITSEQRGMCGVGNFYSFQRPWAVGSQHGNLAIPCAWLLVHQVPFPPCPDSVSPLWPRSLSISFQHVIYLLAHAEYENSPRHWHPSKPATVKVMPGLLHWQSEPRRGEVKDFGISFLTFCSLLIPTLHGPESFSSYQTLYILLIINNFCDCFCYSKMKIIDNITLLA